MQRDQASSILPSNLFLKNKKIEFIAKTQYAVLGTAYGKNGNFPITSIVAPRVGIEPTTKGLQF